MLTRRGVLSGAAAASIAAIAAAHSRAAGAAEAGPGFAFGDVANGLNAGFHQDEAGLNVFLKYENLAVALFYKERSADAIDVFAKFVKIDQFLKFNGFDKTRLFDKWMPVGSFEFPGALAAGRPSFGMVDLQGFAFFLKIKSDLSQGIVTTFAINADGMPQVSANPIVPVDACPS